jgi:hypothetical protein
MAKTVELPEPPEALRTMEFLAIWAEFAQHRREIKALLTPTATRRLFKTLETMGVEMAIAALEQSIEHGWRGVFEPKSLVTQNKATKLPDSFTQLMRAWKIARNASGLNDPVPDAGDVSALEKMSFACRTANEYCEVMKAYCQDVDDWKARNAGFPLWMLPAKIAKYGEALQIARAREKQEMHAVDIAMEIHDGIGESGMVGTGSECDASDLFGGAEIPY